MATTRFRKYKLFLFSSLCLLLIVCIFGMISYQYPPTNQTNQYLTIHNTLTTVHTAPPLINLPMISDNYSYQYSYPFPLYIFQIGFNKCGTGSLFSLFQKNGIPSAHFAKFGSQEIRKDEFGHYKFTLPQIMTDLYLNNASLFNSRLFHQYMFYSDFGVYPGFPTLHNYTVPWYKILLSQHPNIRIKFILNIRNINHWLKSRYLHGYHWNNMFIDFYRDKSDPHSGNINVDISILFEWKRTWYKYMCEVIQYFQQNRPNDLLIFDMEHDSIHKIQRYLNRYGLVLNESYYEKHGSTKKYMTRNVQQSQTRRWKYISKLHKEFLLNDNDDGFPDEYHRILSVCNMKQETIHRFYVFQEYSESVKSYFLQCNESSVYGDQGKKNQYSHLGEKYFNHPHLAQHQWYTDEIEQAQMVILPIYLGMARHGKCDTKKQKRYREKQFESQLGTFFSELLVFANENKEKQYLLIAPDNYICELKKPSSMIEFASTYSAQLIVGHYIKPTAVNRTCFWMNSNTMVVPYTIPFTYKDYDMYEDIADNIRDFEERKYLLFYMGSACTAAKRNPYAMKHRADAINYIRLLNQNEQKHFGVITDYDDSIDSNCDKYSGIDTDIITECKTSNGSGHLVETLPCGLAKGRKSVLNGNNALYRYGLRSCKFNLMIHGDTPSSGKFYDALAFNVINIMIGINKDNLAQYLPFTDVIPYEAFLFFISEYELEHNGLNALQYIMYNTSQAQLDNMIGNMTRYKRYLLWDHNESLVVDQILLQSNSFN
eukprot:461112_1